MSDLTFFESQYRRLQKEAQELGGQGSKQKGINLNADVFSERFFPAARTDGERHRFNIPLTIYGPGSNFAPQILTRKVITAGAGGKNWRLNGELIPSPESTPDRYDELSPGDLVVFAVDGKSEPTSFALVLLAKANPDDAAMFNELSASVGNRRMSILTEAELNKLVESAPPTHPIRELADPDLDDALEAAATGSSEGLRRLRQRGSPRRMTKEAFLDAKLRAEATGLGGEQLLNSHLAGELAAGRIASYKWFAEENAVNPWDFEVQYPTGAMRRIELKTTRAAFNKPFQISQAELEYAAESETVPTDLYRLFEYTEDGAMLSICRDIGSVAREILEAVQPLYPDVRPDSYTVKVSRFNGWSDAQPIAALEIDD